MARGSTRLIVLTGGPGSGKSTLLDALANAGHTIAPEAGRAVIRQQMAIDGPALPWRDRAAFAEAMLAWDLRSYEEKAGRVEPVFFDRGIPDVAGYLSLCGLPIPQHISRACAVFRYNPSCSSPRHGAKSTQTMPSAGRTGMRPCAPMRSWSTPIACSATRRWNCHGRTWPSGCPSSSMFSSRLCGGQAGSQARPPLQPRGIPLNTAGRCAGSLPGAAESTLEAG